MDGKVGSLSVEDKPIFSSRMKAIFANKSFAADKGKLLPGQVVAEQADGEGIPAEVVADADMTGTVNSANKDFTYAHGRPICPGSVAINHGDQDLVDDGSGRLYGDGSGTVNYVSGAVAVSFTAAPDAGAPTISLDDDPVAILDSETDTDNEQLDGLVGLAGSAIKANSFMKDDAAISDAVIKRFRLKGVFFE